MKLIKQAISSLILLGVIPFASFSLVACSDKPATSGTEANTSPTGVAMDHGAMAHSTTMSMDLGPADQNFDLRFIDGMIPHHEGAVTMAQEALQKSNRAEIRQLAEAIIAAQEQEIAELEQWRSTWYPDAGDQRMMYHAEMGHMMPMTEEMRSSMRMAVDLGAADDQFDLRFINAMVPHHEGAVEMAEQALEKSDRPEIKTLAQTIIATQQQEIDQMEQWRKDWYGQ